MRYEVYASDSDPYANAICSRFRGTHVYCGGDCGAMLPFLHLHLWFDGAAGPTGVCSAACADRAVRRRYDPPAA